MRWFDRRSTWGHHDRRAEWSHLQPIQLLTLLSRDIFGIVLIIALHQVGISTDIILILEAAMADFIDVAIDVDQR